MLHVVREAAENSIKLLSHPEILSIDYKVSGGHSFTSAIFQPTYCGLIGAVYLSQLHLCEIELSVIKESVVSLFGNFSFKNSLHPMIENLLFSIAGM